MPCILQLNDYVLLLAKNYRFLHKSIPVWQNHQDFSAMSKKLLENHHFDDEIFCRGNVESMKPRNFSIRYLEKCDLFSRHSTVPR